MKLSEMILDEKIRGTLDQGRNCLIIFEEDEPTVMFEHSLETLGNLDSVLDALYDKAQKFKEKQVKWNSVTTLELWSCLARWGTENPWAYS